jgi:hypothetical protein
MMVLEEIRRKVEDNKGRKSEKLICVTLIEEDSVKISIKNNGYKEAVIIDINSLLSPFVDDETMDSIRRQCRVTVLECQTKYSLAT